MAQPQMQPGGHCRPEPGGTLHDRPVRAPDAAGRDAAQPHRRLPHVPVQLRAGRDADRVAPAHLHARAIGGAGLVIAEATGVSPEARITPADLGLWSDAHIPGHARLTAAIAAAGSVPGIQIAHAGRKASSSPPWVGGVAGDDQHGWEPLAPSAVAFPGLRMPRAMTEADIAQVIADFVATARRSVAAGYRFIEIHAAHGYLLHQFLSPLSNQRNDGWGGDFAGRTRLTREVVAAVRAAIPEEMPLAIRFSHTDWTEGGWTTEETVELSRR
ncbi:oxidoreductase [Teichococcus aestuarii]